MNYPGSLHNHSDYSNLRLRDSIISIQNMIDYALELKYTTLAITDHECLSGHIKAQKYYNKIKKDNPNFKLILGNEIYLTIDNKFFHLILLAKDSQGHKQIREISSRAWLRGYNQGRMKRVPTHYEDLVEVIGENKGHVIMLTACLGSYSAYLFREGKYDLLKKWIIQMRELFGEDNFYLEMQPPEKKGNEQDLYNRTLAKFSVELDIPYIVSTDSHYLEKEDAFIHKSYLISQEGEREVDEFYATTYMMSTEELESYFKDSEINLQIAYKNIQNINDSCEDYDLTKPLRIPELPWKDFSPKSKIDSWYNKIPYLKTFNESSYEGDKVLAKAIVERIESDSSLQDKKTYDAINECLDMTWESSNVNKVHWSAYYLNLQKIIDTCWDAGSLTGVGRGSGVGFILLYILGITQINPLRETSPTYAWRFLNPSRVSVLDIDFDIEGGRRKVVLDRFREVYGQDRVANVVTFATEKSKAAILTAARGLGMDVDEAQYISSLIPSDRGILRTLHQCYYGDKTNDFAPIRPFVKVMDENPKLWEIVQKIEGLVCRMGIHSGGVIFIDEPFAESCSLMTAPDGTVVTAYELHDAEEVSLIKYDVLSIESLDKIHTCLDLLLKDGLIEDKGNLKDTYEAVIGVYNLERDNPEMWKMVHNQEILSLFQMEKQSGIQGIALTKPTSIDDLATLNSVIRLMAQDKDSELPLQKFARFKNDINEWYKEMDSYGLTKEEQKILEPILLPSSGLCECQESFMSLVQIPECGGFDLSWSDRLRKSIAKKKPEEFIELEKEYFSKVEELGLSKNLCNYVWKVLVSTSRGYGFNKSHTLSYSLIGLQEMNLAYRFPVIYWNTACLIVDSGSLNEEENDSTDYSKLARAIGSIKSRGIEVSPPDINKSGFGFVPDPKNNRILFGLKPILNVSSELSQDIIKNREYKDLFDFLERVPIKKQSMVALIKSGAFDQFYNGDRRYILMLYLYLGLAKKSKVTLQNFNGLINYGLVPSQFKKEIQLFSLTKEIRKRYKEKDLVYTNQKITNYLLQNFPDLDFYSFKNGLIYFSFKDWEKFYKKEMEKVTRWISANQEELIQKVNDLEFLTEWDKYKGKDNLAAWEMESLGFYDHEHELTGISYFKYGLTNFFKLPEESLVDYTFTKNGKQIPIYKIFKIIGTVIAKDKIRASISLLTLDGVVNVKFNKEYFAMFDKQISERLSDGKKKVREKSWFNKGTLLMIQGYRRGDDFVAKRYSKTPGHTLYRVELLENKDLLLQSERYQGIMEDSEE